MAEKSMAAAGSEQNPAVREETRSVERYLRPPVDIVETEEGLTIVADLPGVEKEKLEIDIDKGILTIRGEADIPRQGEERYREFGPLSYYRQFQLPEVIDQEKTKAEYVNGVLTLRLFKMEQAKPRKIEIRAS